MYPPINITNVLYKREQEYNSDPNKDSINNVTGSYLNKKWTWKVGNTFKDVQRLNNNIRGRGVDIDGDVDMVDNSVSVNDDTQVDIWAEIDNIYQSKSYELFSNALKIANEDTANIKNYGVTVATTVDATKMTGDQKIRRLRKILGDPEVFGVRRGDIQVMFHEEFLQACLSIIYRGEWELNFDEIMARNRVTSNARERFIICPRRFGKTWAVAMFCAAYLWCIPKVTVSIFSRGKRMAQKLMFLCLRYLLKLPGFSDYVTTSNSEQIVLDFGPNDTRTLCCLPGTPEVRKLILIGIGNLCGVGNGLNRSVSVFTLLRNFRSFSLSNE